MSWESFSNLIKANKKLLICMLLSIIIIVSSVHIFITYFFSDYKICKSPECIDQARKMVSNMNTKIDPCEDFFEFSCGRWVEHNPIPPNYGGWKNINKLTQEFKENIKEIMESNLEDYPDILKLSQKFYNSCMNLPLDNSEFENFTNQQFEDFRGITNLSMYFISVTLMTEISSSYAYDIINLIPLARSYKFPIYEKALINKLWPIGYPNSPLSKEELDSIIDFEEKLANLTSIERNISEYKLDTLDELSNNTIDWKEFFKIYFYGTGVNVDWSKQLIHVHDADFFAKIGEFLKNEDENLIVNVAKWRILYGPHISQRIKNIVDDHYFLLYHTIPEERWKTCTDLIVENFGMAIMNPYVQKYFPSSNKIKLKNMINRIQNAFKTIIERSELISEDIKKAWMETTDGIESLIAFPDWILNSTQLAHYYENLELSNSSNFYLSLQDVARWKNKKDLGLLNTTFDKTIWLTEPFDMGAFFYFKMHNFIVVTAGFLQYPNYGMPLEVLNYAGIGFTLSHEITHVLTANNNFSLANETCLIEQYDQYIAEPIEGLKLNGTFTHDENYADNGGIQIAFKAYQNYLVNERQGFEEERLPGLEHLNSEQLFFLAFTQSMCAAFKTEVMKDILLSDSHSPEQFRVKGLFNNFKEFSQVWNCPRPKNPCLIW